MSIHPGSKLAFVLIAGIPQIVQTNAAKDLRTAVQVLPGLTVVGVSCAGKLPVFIIGWKRARSRGRSSYRTHLYCCGSRATPPAIARICIAVVVLLFSRMRYPYW